MTSAAKARRSSAQACVLNPQRSQAGRWGPSLLAQRRSQITCQRPQLSVLSESMPVLDDDKNVQLDLLPDAAHAFLSFFIVGAPLNSRRVALLSEPAASASLRSNPSSLEYIQWRFGMDADLSSAYAPPHIPTFKIGKDFQSSTNLGWSSAAEPRGCSRRKRQQLARLCHINRATRLAILFRVATKASSSRRLEGVCQVLLSLAQHDRAILEVMQQQNPDLVRGPQPGPCGGYERS